MFHTLIHNHHITTDSVKSFVFENEDNEETTPLRGYLAMKEEEGKKKKYFIEEKVYEELPIRANKIEELYMKESSQRKSIILRPLKPTPFRIKPEAVFKDIHAFIDDLSPFTHTNPDEWTMLKICAVMGYVGKVFLGICSPSEFGKSSAFRGIHGITGKSIVFRPRTPAGLLIQINEDGNIVFDEVQKANKETLLIIEEFCQMVGDNSPVYVNGAKKAKDLKQIYNTVSQSITFLYNLQSYYSNPDTDFFDNVWVNPIALSTKFLKLRFEGELTESFKKDFDAPVVAETSKMYYMKVAKQLLYLKQLKTANAYQRRYTYVGLKLRGRHKLIYDELTWLIDMYSKDSEEYKKLINLLDKCINDYRQMVGEEQILLEEVK